MNLLFFSAHLDNYIVFKPFLSILSTGNQRQNNIEYNNKGEEMLLKKPSRRLNPPTSFGLRTDKAGLKRLPAIALAKAGGRARVQISRREI